MIDDLNNGWLQGDDDDSGEWYHYRYEEEDEN